MNKTHKEMVQKFKNRKWSGTHPCGTGSMFKNTKGTRDLLIKIVDKYNIKTISNAGAGKPGWIKRIKWPHPVEIKHYDIDVKHKNVIKFDITTEILPKTDLIICRHVLNHLYGWDELRNTAMKNFVKSGSTYILYSHEQKTNSFFRKLGEPLETQIDEPYKQGGAEWHFSVWRINDG